MSAREDLKAEIEKLRDFREYLADQLSDVDADLLAKRDNLEELNDDG